MSSKTVSPPAQPLLADGTKIGGWWHTADGRIVCDLCPRACSLKPGDRGFCFVRENVDGKMVLNTYGRSTGFCVDPIEKKPLNHFYPGTSVLSFGTAGCNLGCKFCQNWSISKSREVEILSRRATPQMIAQAACKLDCQSVAYTYNDPVIWAEYAIDTAAACRQRRVKNVAVTAGYICARARHEFFADMDAVNVDLKAFSEFFYQRLTLSHLQPVLETLTWLKHESQVWLEITNLVIPQENDSPAEIRKMCRWIVSHLGPDVPIHFTAFHPEFRLRDRPPTPPETLILAYDIARDSGLRYVYTGNVFDVKRQSTYCPGCGKLVIERRGYNLAQYNLQENRCIFCNAEIAGHFGERPGEWGARRMPVDPRALLYELES
jgi:AmmeMemoRadiSam system radical SAM enzyme